MAWHEVGNRVADHLPFDIFRKPGCLQGVRDSRPLTFFERLVVEIGGRTHIADSSAFVYRNGLETLRDHPLASAAARTPVLRRVLEMEQHPQRLAVVGFVH